MRSTEWGTPRKLPPSRFQATLIESASSGFHLCRGMFPLHLRGEFSDLCQIALHFTPTVPRGVVRTGVEGSLERAHAVL